MNVELEDVEVISSSAPSDISRRPASVNPDVTKLSKAITIAKYDLDCSGKSTKRVSVNGEFVQIKGLNCRGDLSSKNVEVVNKSNGYTAEIFESHLGMYQTDLIQLQPGLNNIFIRYVNSFGNSVEELLEVKTADKSTP